MLNDELDQSLLLQFNQCLPCKRATDLQTLGNDGRGDELVAGHFLEKLLVGALIEKDQVVKLVADLSFRPFLLIRRNKTWLDTDGKQCVHLTNLLLGLSASS